jgi:2-oxoglutarate dehydrogenase E2 component (dihydrolipoamide succinyltransferase)
MDTLSITVRDDPGRVTPDAGKREREMKAIRVPSLAENVNEATVARWLVAEGDRIEPGAPVAELLTEKAEFTLEAEGVEGTLSHILAPEKSVLPVGSVLCLLDGGEADVRGAEEENRLLRHRYLDAPTIEMHSPLHPEKTQKVPRAQARPGVRATPAARRLAKEHGVELERIVTELQIDGAVKEEDVREYLERTP